MDEQAHEDRGTDAGQGAGQGAGLHDDGLHGDALHDGTRARRRRRAVAVAVTAGAVAAAVAFGAVVTRSTDRPSIVDAAGPPASSPVDPVDDVLDDPASVVALTLDFTAPRIDRLATIAAGDPEDTAGLLDAIDTTTSRAGVTPESMQITTRWHEGDTALVDARLELSGDAAQLSGAVQLGPIQLERADGTWRMTQASLCGIARAGASLGLAVECGTEPTFTRADGLVGLADLLHDDGVAADPGAAISTGVWGDPVTRTDDIFWYADYPELRLGGGGPVGPAEIVAVDLDDGEVVQRVLLEGTEAVLAPGSDDDVQVLHWVPAPDPAVPPTPHLTRIDARTGRGADTELPPGTSWITAGPDGVWVFELARVGLLRDGASIATLEMTDVPGPIDPTFAASTDQELWIPGGSGRPATVIDGRDGTTRQVEVPGDRLVGSADRVWAIGATADSVGGGSASAWLLRDDGSIEREVTPPDGLVGSWMDGTNAWGDGAGGIWLTGSLPTSPDILPASISLPVIDPRVAYRIGTEPGDDASIWTTGSSDSGPSWFRPAGTTLGVSSGAEVALFDQ